MYQVKLIKGGPLSGRLFRRRYFPKTTYTYGPEDKKYVEEVLKTDARFSVEEKAPEKAVDQDVSETPEKASDPEDSKAPEKAASEATKPEEAQGKAKGSSRGSK